MKKNSIYALMSAIALSGGVMFSGCSSSDDVVTNEYGEEINPTYDPVAKTVKTNFSISLNSNLQNDQIAKTRQNGTDATQADNSFQGISAIRLLAYDTTQDPSLASGTVVDIGTSINTSSLNALDDSYNYHYINVVVPTGTNRFLFYGVSSKGNKTTPNDRFKYGVLTPTLADKTSQSAIKFDVVPTKTDNSSDGSTIASYLTNIAGATITLADESTKSWYQYTTDDDAELPGYYAAFTKIDQKMAGSSNSVKEFVSTLYNNLWLKTDDMSKKICALILQQGETVYATDNDGVEGAPTGVLAFQAAFPSNYPSTINVPDGSAVLMWRAKEGGGREAYVPASESFKELSIADQSKFVYPPSLYYYTNSPIHVSSTIQDGKYKTESNWNTILNGYSTGTSVLSSTTDIALDNEIQYAVGRLELRIKAKTATVKDKKGADVDLTTGNGLQISGVLIGGQQNVSYDFTPSGNTEYVIWDKDVVNTSVTGTSFTDANHTLVLECAAGTKYIAVEMINKTDRAFEGADGLIPINGKFYLVAALDPMAAKVPGSATDKVFSKDKVTKVDLTISTNSDASGEVYPNGLGAAYSTIPDLGTPALRLGFSVDLSWTNGFVFEPEI